MSKSKQNSSNKVTQFAKEVVDFSSQYGSENSITYTVCNLAGQNTVHPEYGDYTQACVLRTYGPWWLQAPSAERNFIKTPNNFRSHDYIDLSFEQKVYPNAVEIYETYNPGTVVRILACDTSAEEGNSSTDHVKWFVLWEGISTFRKPRSNIFSPEIKKCPFPTNLIRLEFNSIHCDYYTELDAIKVTGDSFVETQVDARVSNHDDSQSKTAISPQSIWDSNMCLPCSRKNTSRPSSAENYTGASNDFSKVCDSTLLNAGSDIECVGSPVSPAEIVTQGIAQLHIQDGLSAALDISDNGCFDLLPGEVIQHIMSYLDLPSLCNMASSCQLFHRHCYDPYQYSELNLQPYWTHVTSGALRGLVSRCSHLQRLSLAWCGNYNHITTQGYNNFIQVCGKELTCLKLSCCKFLTGDSLKLTVKACQNVKELYLQCCRNVEGSAFEEVKQLKNLQTLNLYRTLIKDDAILSIIRSCKSLEHLNLGSCKEIRNFDDVARTLGENCKQLKSIDLWRGKQLSPIGLSYLYENCHLLEELDLGWCSHIQSSTGCIVDLVENCKMIKKIYLTAIRTVNDRDLEAIAKNLRGLEQLDILGTTEVAEASIVKILEKCKQLKMFDLSFCGSLKKSTVLNWRKVYPNVDIKRSFQEQDEEEK